VIADRTANDVHTPANYQTGFGYNICDRLVRIQRVEFMNYTKSKLYLLKRDH